MTQGIINHFNIPIEEARGQALDLYKQGWLLYPEYQQIMANLSNARSFLLLAKSRNDNGATFQPDLFDSYVQSGRK